MNHVILGGRERPRRAWLAPTLLASIVLCAAPARADHAADQAQAEALYEKGRMLLKEDKAEEAYAKLLESQKLDPASGTLFLLAECHKRAGRIASRWLALRQVLSVADREHRPERIAEAKRQIAEIEKDLPYLNIRLGPAAAAIPGLVVERDGDVVKGGFGDEAPVDPGKHKITVRARGYRTAVLDLDVTLREHESVDVPVLVADPSSPGAAKPAGSAAPLVEPSSESGSVGRTVGVVVAGLGVGGVVVGALFSGLARQNQDEAKRLCPTSPSAPCVSVAGQQYNAKALQQADIATVSISLGAGFVGLGALLFAFSPRLSPKPATTGATAPRVALTSVSPVVSPSGGGLWVGAAF